MFVMRRILILFAVILLGFGCVEQKTFPGSAAEHLSNTQSFDLDQDGISDYSVYDFTPVTNQEVRVQRQITVATRTKAEYISLNQNLTDVDLLIADQSLEEFSNARSQAEMACSQSIGLLNVVCSDLTTCSRLCAASSARCRRISENYQEVLAASMISYVQDADRIRPLILESRQMVTELRTGSDEERAEFLDKTREMAYKVAEINANPLYTNPDLTLCTHSDFGVPNLNDAAEKIGNYTAENDSYHYYVLVTVKPVQESDDGGLGVETTGVEIVDKMSKGVISDPDSVYSMQSIATSEDALNVIINWSSTKRSKEGYILLYEFTSTQPPELLLSSLRTPAITVKKTNLAFLVPTNSLLVSLNGLLGNYYLAFGGAIGITAVVVIFIYTLVTLGFTVISGRMGGMTLTMAARKALGRTEITWKTDILVTIISFAIGYYLATAMAVSPSPVPQLDETLDFFLTDRAGADAVATAAGVGAAGLIMIGLITFYWSVENIAKIIILERVYGMVIRQEKDMFLAKAAALKDRIKELSALIEKYREEEFDVSQEYDVLMTVRADKVDELARNMTARSKVLIGEHTEHIENALSSLIERKKVADENWPKWKENIEKTLQEQDEVLASSLLTIPASLRTWALGRFTKEKGAEGLVLEHNGIKRRRIAPERIIEELIERDLIKGAIVIKNEKIAIASLPEGSGTVTSALALKLRTYLHSLAKNLGQQEPRSFAVQGNRMIIAYLKNRTIESVLFISKDKFKDAIEQWKAKTKLIEGA